MWYQFRRWRKLVLSCFFSHLHRFRVCSFILLLFSFLQHLFAPIAAWRPLIEREGEKCDLFFLFFFNLNSSCSTFVLSRLIFIFYHFYISIVNAIFLSFPDFFLVIHPFSTILHLYPILIRYSIISLSFFLFLP